MLGTDPILISHQLFIDEIAKLFIWKKIRLTGDKKENV